MTVFLVKMRDKSHVLIIHPDKSGYLLALWFVLKKGCFDFLNLLFGLGNLLKFFLGDFLIDGSFAQNDAFKNGLHRKEIRLGYGIEFVIVTTGTSNG